MQRYASEIVIIVTCLGVRAAHVAVATAKVVGVAKPTKLLWLHSLSMHGYACVCVCLHLCLSLCVCAAFSYGSKIYEVG